MIGINEVLQLFGRAGRPKYDKEGRAMLIAPYKERVQEDTYHALELLPGEQVVCKEQIGPLSRLDLLPKSYSVITTKRFFVVRPFAGKRAISYDKIASLNVRKGILATKLIINMKDSAAAGAVVSFVNSSKAIAAFSTISNQILASRDKNNAARESHRKALEKRGAASKKAVPDTAKPKAAPGERAASADQIEPAKRAVEIGKIISAFAAEKTETLKERIERDGSRGMATIAEGAQRAWPVVNAAINSVLGTARKTMSEILPLVIARKQQGPQSLEPIVESDDMEVAYLNDGEAFGLPAGTLESSGDTVFIGAGHPDLVEKKLFALHSSFEADADGV